MSCEVFHLKELDVEQFEIQEVLLFRELVCVNFDVRSAHGAIDEQVPSDTLWSFVLKNRKMKMAAGIFHTIMFHRALGLIRPKEIDLELFDITYVQCGDVEVERKIDEKIIQFIDRVKKHPNQKHQICVSFYEVKNKQASWFANKDERHYWEHWYINLSVAHHPKAGSGKSHHSKVVNPGESAPEERDARHSGLELSLREVLFQIINFGNEKKDHIPPISNLEGASFPFEITISSSSDSAFGMELLKKMLQTGRPTMLG